jgi:hypothetical protein
MGPNGVAYDSITTIHGIGKDWGRLPHREPFRVKRSKDRRREHHGYVPEREVERGVFSPQEDHELEKDKSHTEGFEITV